MVKWQFISIVVMAVVSSEMYGIVVAFGDRFLKIVMVIGGHLLA